MRREPKTRNKDQVMRRLLILTAASTLVIASAATISASARTTHHHYRDAHASYIVPDGAAIPADTLNNHDAYMKNLHDSGYNPHGDFDAHGIIKIN
jgi:hypothetical protein